MPTIEVTDEEYKFLKELSKELNTQDNRCTADPLGFLIRYTDFEPGPEDLYDSNWRIDYYMDGDEFDSEEELREYIEKNYDKTEYGVESMISDGTFYMRPVSKFETNFFLTAKECEAHIKCNKHNLRGDPHSYGIHMFRNPEMEKLLKILKKIGD